MGCIYCATCKINGKKYIGKSVSTMQKRKRDHEREAQNGKDFIFYHAIRKYGKDNFEWSILWDNLEDEDLIPYEIAMIRKHKTKKPNGYNMTNGGNSPMTGRKHTEESKKKMSISQKNKVRKPHSEETKIKIGNANRGHKWTTEQIMRISILRRGRKLSEEHKNKLRIPRTEETKKRISATLLGHFVSDKTRRKLSVANKGKLKGKPWTKARRIAQEARQSKRN